MTRALSKEVEENILAHRLMGQWSPMTTTFEELIINPNPEDQISTLSIFLAYPIDQDFQDKELVQNYVLNTNGWDEVPINNKKRNIFVESWRRINYR